MKLGHVRLCPARWTKSHVTRIPLYTKKKKHIIFYSLPYWNFHHAHHSSVVWSVNSRTLIFFPIFFLPFIDTVTQHRIFSVVSIYIERETYGSVWEHYEETLLSLLFFFFFVFWLVFFDLTLLLVPDDINSK